jgi:GTP-binding protein HflX
MEVLEQLACENKPLITVLNKIDLLSDASWLGQMQSEFPNAIPVSARTGAGLDRLQDAFQDFFAERIQTVVLKVPHSRMDLVNLFYKEGKVLSIKYLAGAIKVKVSLPKTVFLRIRKDKDIEKIDN